MTKTLHTFLTVPMCATCLSPFILLDLIILSKNYEAPHYEILSRLLLPPHYPLLKHP
jgi:hypothetical protein